MRQVISRKTGVDEAAPAGRGPRLTEDDRLFLDTLKDYHLARKYKYMSRWLTKRHAEHSPSKD
jgi:hypothetical protein